MQALGIALDRSTMLGTRDFTTVLTAEQNLYTAQNDLAIAEGNVSAGLASVYRALGGGWQIREGDDFVPPHGARRCGSAPIGAICCRRSSSAAAGPRGCRPPKISAR